MAEEKKQDERQRANHDNDVEIGPLGKDDGNKIINSIRSGNMVAVLSGMEIMYVFLFRGEYQCFIHPMDGPEGRHKAWPVNDRNTAMLKNLNSTADQLFEIRFKPTMDFMGVMVAAERGIINFLDYFGMLPAEDTDFMDWAEKNDEGGS
jgi:hypothetical protein